MSASALPPAAIADAAAAVRAFLRDAGDGEPEVLAQAAASAIAIGEAYTGSVLIARTCEDVLPVLAPRWQLLQATPVTAIAGVTALPSGAAPFVLALDGYAVDLDADGRGWVRVVGGGAGERVAVSYTAGLAADWAALPAPLAQGVVMLAAHLFANREATALPPAAVSALWRPYRRLRLAAAEHLA